MLRLLLYMASLTRFSFAAQTTSNLLYTPLSAGGLTGLDVRPGPGPGFLIAVGRIVQRVLSLSTTAGTSRFKWLSLGNFSRRHFNLHPIPTSAYYLEPTKTLLATGNCSLAIIAVPPLICFFSLLLGAGLALGRRGGSSLSTVYRQKNENLSSKSLYSESATLFHQDDTALPPMPRLSSFWISALRFCLRGLAFLFRLICMEKLLDLVEDNDTEWRAATSTDSPIAELRALNRRLGQAINVTTPAQTVMSLARLPDANETLVAPVSIHAKSKPGQGLPPSEHDKVDVISLPEDVKARPPTSVEIHPSVTRSVTRNASATPPVEDVFVGIAGPLGLVHAGAPSVASFKGDKSLPTSYRRSSSRIRRPISSPDTVPDVPDVPSPVLKSSPLPFRQIRLTTDDRPLTPPRHNKAVSLSVEPSGVPARFEIPTALQPHEEAIAQAVAQLAKCPDSPQRPRYSKPSSPALDVASKPRPVSIYQAEVKRLFQLCYDDLSKFGKPAATSSVRPVDRTSETDTGHRTTVSVKQEVRPKTPARNDVTNSLKNFRMQPRDGVASTSGTEKIPPRLLASTPQKDRCGTDALESTRELLSRRSSTVEANRSRFATVEAMREDARIRIIGAREAAAAFDLRMRTKYPAQFSGTENHLESVQSNRQDARRPIQRSQEAVAASDMRIQSTDTDPQMVREEKPQDDRMRFQHDDLTAPNPHDEERELRGQSMSSRSQATKNSPGFKRSFTLPSSEPEESQEVPTTTQSRPTCELPRATLFSKFRPLTMPASDPIARLHSLLELDVPVAKTSCAEESGSTIKQTSLSFGGYVRLPPLEELRGISVAVDQADEIASPESSWRIKDHIPEGTDDETEYNDSLNDGDGDEVECVASSESESSSRSHALVQDQPQKIHDVFYSPTFAPSTHPVPTTNFLKRETLTRFGFGSPCGRQIQRLDARDTFSTSTPRVNYAHLGGFSTSTPRRDVDHRRDTWVDFF